MSEQKQDGLGLDGVDRSELTTLILGRTAPSAADAVLAAGWVSPAAEVKPDWSNCVHGVTGGCRSYRCGSNCDQTYDRMHPCLACVTAEWVASRAAVAERDAELERLRAAYRPMSEARLRTEAVLNAAFGEEELDGAGEGLASDVQLVVDQRDEARAEVEQLREAVKRPEATRAMYDEVCNERAVALRQATRLLETLADRDTELAEANRRLGAVAALADQWDGFESDDIAIAVVVQRLRAVLAPVSGAVEGADLRDCPHVVINCPTCTAATPVAGHEQEVRAEESWSESDRRDVAAWLIREADQRVKFFPQRRDGVDALMRHLALAARTPGTDQR